MNYKILSILLLTFILSFSIAYSDTNGIWNSPEDTLGGVFGADEQARTFNYTFINPVHFNETVSFRTFFGFGGFENPQTEVDIDGRWFVRSHGSTPTTGSGMFGSYNPTVNSGVGIIQVWDYDNGVAKDLLLQREGGNVGIGTVNPTEKLEVIGNIKANEIIVDNLQLPGGDLQALYVNEGQANSIDSSMIINGAVYSADIRDGTIQRVDMGANSIDSSKVVDNSLTASDLAANSVGSSELAANSVSSVHVIDNSLTANDLAPNSVGSSEINSNQVQRRISGACGSGYSIRVIRSDGSVVCERDDQGLSGSLSISSRLSSACPRTGGRVAVTTRFCIGGTCSGYATTGYMWCPDLTP